MELNDKTLLGIAEVLAIAFVLAMVLKPSFAEGFGHLLLAHAKAWRAARREYANTFVGYSAPVGKPYLVGVESATPAANNTVVGTGMDCLS